MAPKPPTYKMTLARIPRPADEPIVAVLLPWQHFKHPFGVATYKAAVSRAGGVAIAVSRDPDGHWHQKGDLSGVWKKFIEHTPIEKLSWETHTFQGSTPWEGMG